MAENSKIEWTDHTFNPWIGCTKVSDGCKHCYAETLMDKRYGRVKWGPQGTRVRTSAANWKKPLRWNRKAQGEGQRYKVFCASLADVFEIQPGQPEMAQWRMDLFELIRQTPNLDWLLLTKRPENVMISEPVYKAQKLPDNVWIGTSVENQETANKRIPELLKVPAKVRFLSCEPLLDAVDLRLPYAEFYTGERIHWVIVGGESGLNARPMHPDWARSIRDQCVAAGVAFHFKQWGNWSPMLHADSTGKMHFWPNGGASQDVGKHAAGRMLDGRTWDEFPE